MNAKQPVGSVKEAPRVEPSALVICCSAYDAYPDVLNFVRDVKGIASYDLITLPGGACAVSRSNNQRDVYDYLLTEIRFIVQAHNLPLVMIFGHVDPPCAKYKDTGCATSDIAQFMAEDISSASRAIRMMCHKKIKTERYLSFRNGQGEIAFYAID